MEVEHQIVKLQSNAASTIVRYHSNTQFSIYNCFACRFLSFNFIAVLRVLNIDDYI